jgi:aryl-alcohol dehydrogenase-like predicted oxidoreductase
MHYHRIPHSALEISQLGLGTMTFGEQNSEADAHAQLDYAVSQGINLIDVAEMYPVPPRPETQGLTETYVGNWLAKRGNREKLVLPQSQCGPARNNDTDPPEPDPRSQKYPRRAGCQPEAPANRLSRPLPGALAQRSTNCFGKL